MELSLEASRAPVPVSGVCSSAPRTRAFGRWRWLARLSVVLLAWFAARTASALEVPPLTARISDRAELLTPDREAELEGRLEAYERATGHQLAVLTIASLEGEPLEDYTMRVVEAWKLGRKDRDDGILLLVVSQDRKIRIEVGYGLEGDLPDVLAGRIVREVIAPAFRQGEYATGIAGAVDAIIGATGGDGKPLPPPAPVRERRSPELGPFGLLLLFAVLFLFGGGFGGGRRRSRAVGSAPLFFGGFGGSRGGFSGGGGFRGGGGGFRGGGGGFGGGGASGSW
jgi:uncharacterized protein